MGVGWGVGVEEVKWGGSGGGGFASDLVLFYVKN